MVVSSTKRRIMITLDTVRVEALQREADRLGISLSAAVSIAVSTWLDAKGHGGKKK